MGKPTANASGSYATTLEFQMAAFDKLPSEIRQRLANAVDNWVPQPLLSKWRRCGNKALVLAEIDRWDAIETDEHWYRMNRLQNSGVDYNVPIRRRKSRVSLDASKQKG